MEDLRALVPTTKHETEKAIALARLGFPAVRPVIAEILEWTQDSNWPVARVFTDFLAQVGPPAAPHVRPILAGSDDGWTYSLLTALVARSPGLARELRPELLRIASHPCHEEIDQVAAAILAAIESDAPGAIMNLPDANAR